MGDLIANRYEEIRPLGSGGMGDVLLVRDTTNGELRALKRLRLADADAVNLLRDEFAALARLSHPNLVRVFDYGTLPEGTTYFTMEYLEGRPLARAVLPGDVTGALRATRDVLSGLEALHAAGHVHCDLKPANLFVVEGADGSSGTRILDLGLAGPLGQPRGERVRGTPGYVAPEVLAGGPYTRDSDLYALGATLYRILTGRLAFPGRDAAEIQATQRRGAPAILPLRVANVPAALDAPLLGLLSVDPRHRSRAARDLIELANRRADGAGRPPRVLDVLSVSGPLVGRDAVLSELKANLLGGDSVRAAILSGPYGSGRTRLAHELAVEAELAAWTVLWFDADHPPGKPRKLPPGTRVLVVADDMDRWSEAAVASLELPAKDRSTALLFVQGRPAQEGDAIYRYLLRIDSPPAPTSIALEPLDAEAAELLVAQRMGGTVPADVVPRMTAAVGSWPGPLLLELDRWLRTERLVREAGGWRVSEMAPTGATGALRDEDEGSALMARLVPESRMAAFVVAGWPTEASVDQLAAISGVGVERLQAAFDDLQWTGHLQQEDGRRRILPAALARALRQDTSRGEIADIRRRLHDALEQSASAETPGTPSGPILLALGCHKYALGDRSGARGLASQALHTAIPAELTIAEEATDLLLSWTESGDPEDASALADAARRWSESGNGPRADELWRAARATLASGTDIHAADWAIQHARLLTNMARYSEAIALLDELLDPEGRFRLSPVQRGTALSERGWCRVRIGERDTGLEDLRQALALVPAEEAAERAIAVMRLGILLYLAGTTQEGGELLDQALELAVASGDPEIEARVRGNLGLRYRLEGDLGRAETEIRAGLSLIGDTGRSQQEFGLQASLLNLTYDLCDWSAWADAQRSLETSSRESGNPVSLSLSIQSRAIIASLRGNAAELVTSLRLERPWISGQHREQRLYWQAQSGFALMWLGEEREAGKRLKRAVLRARSHSLSTVEAIASRWLAELALMRGQTDSAVRWSERALAVRGSDLSAVVHAALCLARAAMRKRDLAQLLENRERFRTVLGGGTTPALAPALEEIEAYVALLEGRLEDAERLIESASRQLQDLDLAPRQILAEREFGLALLSNGNASGAAVHLERAHSIAVRCGIHGWAHRIAEDRVISAAEPRALRAQVGEPPLGDSNLLSRVIDLMNSMLEFPTLLQRALGLAAESIGADRGFILLTDGPDLALRSVAQYGGVDDAARTTALEISRTIVRRVARTGESFMTDDAGSDPRLGSTQSVLDMAVRSLICVPLRLREHVIGTIYLESRTNSSQFSETELDLVESFANLIAVAIENGRLHDDLKRSRDKVIGQNLSLRRDVSKRFAKPNLLGHSPEIQRVLSEIERVAVTKSSVLIRGESGTGKELVAKTIHYESPRADQTFFSLNCASIGSDLLESQLFGIEKRVASEVDARPGFFERADGGTLFLDEIGDMPLFLQTSLLRVLEEGEVTRVGGSKVIPVDFRLITATNKDLRQLIRDKVFREDLYFRIFRFAIDLPPLRERKIDIPLLAEHFLQKFCEENGRPVPKMSADFTAVLLKSMWEGNVRELKNYVEGHVLLCSGPYLEPMYLPTDLGEGASRPSSAANRKPTSPSQELGDAPEDFKRALEDFERSSILKALEVCDGNQRDAARKLGLAEGTLRYNMNRLGIERPSSSKPRRGRPARAKV